VVSKLSEVLFVEALRCYVQTLPSGQTGWLAGRAGLSRTRLAERFRHFLGVSPMAYLAQWRLKLGAEMLESGDHSVAEVAAAVGYGSEAAFNRAFKREFGCPPAQFRRERNSHFAGAV
jgi:AraC-like DNA-binding protein